MAWGLMELMSLSGRLNLGEQCNNLLFEAGEGGGGGGRKWALFFEDIGVLGNDASLCQSSRC